MAETVQIPIDGSMLVRSDLVERYGVNELTRVAHVAVADAIEALADHSCMNPTCAREGEVTVTIFGRPVGRACGICATGIEPGRHHGPMVAPS